MLYRDQKVVTTSMLADLLECKEKFISNYLMNHSDEFVEGADTFILKGNEYRIMRNSYLELKGPVARFWTEQGAAKIRDKVHTNYNPINYEMFWIERESVPAPIFPSQDTPDSVSLLQKQVDILQQQLNIAEQEKRELFEASRQKDNTIENLSRVINKHFADR